MKKMKRLIVLCLVATLCMGLAVPAMAANASQAEAYVTQLYRGLLNREPDDAGKLSYVTQIVTNGAKAGTIAESVAGSAEFRARILTNEEYVTALYRGLLGREPDAAGLATFKGALDVGYSRNWVFEQLLSSMEFTQRCVSFGLQVGAVSAPDKAPSVNQTQVNSTAAAEYVERLYVHLLGRTSADDSAAVVWVNKLTKREMSAAGVAANIAGSAEARAIDRTRGDFVTAAYWTLLDRAPDSNGLDSYTSALSKGYSRSWVFTKICASAEFQSRSEFADMNVVPGYLNSASYNMG